MDLKRWLDAVDEPVFALDRLERFVAVNEAGRFLTGFQIDELIGAHCTRVFRDGLSHFEAPPPDSRSIPRGETVLTRKDGAKHAVRASRSSLELQPGEHWTLYTVHPEPALRPTGLDPRERQRLILDSLDEGVVTIDENWRVTALNTSAIRILGIPEHAALGLLCSHVLRSELCQGDCPLARVLEKRSSVRNERVHLTRHDGQPVPVSINCAVLRDSVGEGAGGVLSFRELPEPREPQAELVGEGFHGMVGRSGPMNRVFRLIQEVADSPSTVLITGEPGVGKELVANALQRQSARRDGPFVRIDCSVFSEGDLESELFGHAMGSFADARRDHRGRFELADGGTLFLDEIGELSQRLQARLLRVLQDRTFERVGGESTVRVDIRLIAATSRDLEQRVLEGEFREDLFYQLSIIPLHVPPLRDRREDVPVLIDHFVRKLAHLTKKPVRYVDDEALGRLIERSWPGNVRELENAIEYAFARAKDDVLTADLFPPEEHRPEPADESPSPHDTEAHVLLGALERQRWHHGRAAEELGISRTTLWRRMRRLGIETSPQT